MATYTEVVAVVRILGIDPGTQVVGFGCLELVVEDQRQSRGAVPLALRTGNTIRAGGGGSGDVRLVDVGVLRLGGRGVSLAARLLALAEQFRRLLEQLEPTEVALEEAFYGKSVQAALRIGEARGVVLAESARAELAVHQFAPARVKRCVTGRGAASKESVASMVGQLVRTAPGSRLTGLPTDATDAVAVALTRVEQRQSPILHAGFSD